MENLNSKSKILGIYIQNINYCIQNVIYFFLIFQVQTIQSLIHPLPSNIVWCQGYGWLVWSLCKDRLRPSWLAAHIGLVDTSKPGRHSWAVALGLSGNEEPAQKQYGSVVCNGGEAEARRVCTARRRIAWRWLRNARGAGDGDGTAAGCCTPRFCITVNSTGRPVPSLGYVRLGR